MTAVLSEVVLDGAAVRRLRDLPGVSLRLLAPHDAPWNVTAELLPETEVLLCKRPPDNLDDMTALRWMQLSTVGYEHLRHLHLAERPFRVCNARGIFDTAIGEWCLAMMVNLTRDLRGMIRNQEVARWDRSSAFQQEMRGRVVGMWGYGGIGRETARLAKAFGMQVHVMTRSRIKPRHNAYTEPGTGDPEGVLPDRVFVTGQEQAFLSGLDFLVLALPHTRQSDGMVGEAELQALPRSAFLLNPARGLIVQEQALLKALQEGWIAGAALDTHFTYPLPPNHPLWRFPNVIVTPHISGADESRQFPARITELLIQNVMRHLEGRPLLNEITAADWTDAEIPRHAVQADTGRGIEREL